MKKTFVVLLAFAIASLAAPSRAQDSWPSRPVRVIVPSSPGGGTDLYARLISQALSESLKQQFIVDNRPGASGNIGAEAAAKSAPDGYTILVSANPALTVNPSLYRNLPYNTERDLTPITRGVIAPQVLTVHESVPARTLAELIALAKKDPGRLAFGSAGTGSPTYLGIRVLEEVSGARFTHVPYKGIGQGYKDLVGGQLAFMFPDAATAVPYIKAGKVFALAVNEKTPLLPDVPTFKELGYPKVDDVFTSFSVVVPAGTPSAIIQRLSAEIAKAMKSPALADKLAPQGLVPVFDTPEQAAASLKKERDGWAEFIKRNNIQPNE
jgi:tripartite-type tricarboxylate transporter receptor subunit TctC